MDISILNEFTYLSKDLNFTKTAERLYLSQSVLSRHIQSLESEVGCKLFTRDKNGVSLTDAGAVFARSAKLIVNAYTDALAQLHSLEDGFQEILRVGYIRDIARPFVDRLYADALERHPHVRIRLIDSWEERIGALLSQDRIDIALMLAFDVPDPSVYDSIVLYEDSYDIFVPKRHALAAASQLTFDELEGEKLLIPSEREHPLQYGRISKVLADHPSIIFRDLVINEHDNAALTNSGHGLALVRHQHAQNLEIGGAKAIPLVEERLTHEVRAVWKRANVGRTLQGFIDLLEEEEAR